MYNKITLKTIIFSLCIVFAIIIGGIIYFKFNPEEHLFFPKCSFLVLTGLKCPGCGSQRTIHALLHADIRSAFSYNALVMLSIPYLLILIVGKIIRFFKPYSKFAIYSQHPYIIRSFFIIVILFWITRNIFDF